MSCNNAATKQNLWHGIAEEPWTPCAKEVWGKQECFPASQMDQFALTQLENPEMRQARNTALPWQTKRVEFPLWKQHWNKTTKPSLACAPSQVTQYGVSMLDQGEKWMVQWHNKTGDTPAKWQTTLHCNKWWCEALWLGLKNKHNWWWSLWS